MIKLEYIAYHRPL